MTLCTSCNTREVKSPNLTGELCTSCYFNSRKDSISTPIIEASSQASEGRVILNSLLDTIIIEEEIKKPSISIDDKKREPGKLYCQSCIERYGRLVDASREWKSKYYVCEDCYRPLLRNVLGYELERVEVERIRTIENGSTPLLNAFYDLINLPANLRFDKTDDILNSREDFYSYHSEPLVNLELKEITQRIETLQVMLFQIKKMLEPCSVIISNAKRDARANASITIPGASSKTSSKGNGESKPSKIKLNEMEKMAKMMYPNLTLQDALSEIAKLQASLMKK